MNAIVQVATEQEILRVLENSLYPGAKPESIALVLSYCRMNNIDPLLRPVHIVPTSVKLPNGQYETRDVLMPGIADYRIKAGRSGEYGGKSEPEYGPDIEGKWGNISVTYPAWCRITVSRIVQGHARQFTATERWTENYATAKRDTDAPNTMWRKRPYGQLAKCAEAQALRMAFPEFSGGQPTAEEMEGKTFTGTTINAEPETQREPTRAAASTTPRPERVYAKDERPTNGNGGSNREAAADQTKAAIEGWQIAFNSARDTEAVRRLETGLRYTAAMEHAPAAIADALRAMCAQAYLRVQPPAAPIGNAPENATAPTDRSPWDDEQPIEIKGQEYAGA